MRLCRSNGDAALDTLARERLQTRTEEVVHLRQEVRRLERSRAWGGAAMAQSTEVVSIAKGELDALRRDLAVRCPRCRRALAR